MFVILHEMAHLMTTTVGHTPEFWANFRRILHDASSIQIYRPVNYAQFTHSLLWNDNYGFSFIINNLLS
jgi:predicted metal-dependent hydrolase